MLDNRYALLFVRGERPVMDLKYDILKHPNVKLTADGGKPPYIHGEPTQAVATLVFDGIFLRTPKAWKPSALPMSFCPMRTWKKYSIYKEESPYETFQKNEKKATQKLPMGRKAKRCSPCMQPLVLCMVFWNTRPPLLPMTRLPVSTTSPTSFSV